MRRALVTLSLSLLMVTGALAHSWYDGDCCSKQDCEPVEADKIERGIHPRTGKSGQWMTNKMGRAFVPDDMPKEKRRISRDLKSHVCQRPGIADWERLSQYCTANPSLCNEGTRPPMPWIDGEAICTYDPAGT